MKNQRVNVKRGNDRAFTLMELLITVSIIGVLAALVVPMAQKSLESSKSAKSTSTMKNLQHCAIQCQAEYGGAYYRKITSPYGRLYWVVFYVTEYSE